MKNGARVPGTKFELDPVTAAFNIGTIIRWLDYNDTWLAAEWGHPSDNFGGQEYQQDTAISAFCKSHFGVTFPLTTRVDVKGDNATPIYKYLCNKSENGVLDATISWNFNKFIIDEKGNLLAHFDSKVTPQSDELAGYINK